jgi:short-subunit dehydrogenase
MAGLAPVVGLGAYPAAKAAVVGYTEALDIEFIGARVRVSVLCPGAINTAIVGVATMHGTYEAQRSRTAEFYAKRGTSSDVVARQDLAAVSRGWRIVPTPRYQGVPRWLIKRVAPGAGRRPSVAAY